MSRALALVYAALVGLLVFGAAGLWRIRCEGFGCSGVGIAWLAWAALFVPILGFGLTLRAFLSSGATLARLASFALWVQAGTGAAMLVLWVSKNAV